MQKMRKWFFLLFIMGLCAEVHAQEAITVTGKVSDATTSEPLIGVTVTVKGSETKSATITNMDGAFELKVASENDELIFSYVSYVGQQIKVGSKKFFEVRLDEDTKALGEVVVVGYGKQKRGSITGAISDLKSSDLVRTTTSTTSGALVGKIPGVSARQTDGRPGAAATIQIRNMGTPLYVIDGMPASEGQFNNIDINDIDNISVLKDGSAAVYGLQAANGVVLVTTKAGKRGEKNQINATGYYGIQNFMRYPKPANAYQYNRALMESDLNLGGSTNRMDNAELENWRVGEGKYKNMDWYDFIVHENAPVLYGNINASGGSDRINYYFSLSHINQDAMINGFNFDRTNIQTNVEANVTNRLKVGTRINGRIEGRHNVGVPGLDDYWQPYWAIFQNRPTEQAYANGNPNYPNNTHNNSTGAAVFDRDITGYTEDVWKVLSTNFFAEYQFPLKGLTARAAYSYNIAQRNDEQFEYTYNVYEYDEATDTYNTKTGNQNPWRRRTNEQNVDQVIQAQLNYQNTFGGAHNMSALFATEASQSQLSFLEYNTLPPNNYIGLTYVDDITGMSNKYNERARAGFIFRGTYDYSSRYFLEVSGRYDGSFLFKPGNRWGFFPAVSTGWRMSEEPFIKSVSGNWLYNLKLRASYGEMGDDRYKHQNRDNVEIDDIVEPFGYLDVYKFGDGGTVLNGQDVKGIRNNGLPITTLSWIKASIFNVGIDYGLFNNRLSGTLEYFYRKRTGLPGKRYDVIIPKEVGFDIPDENLKSDAHLGIEGSILWADKFENVNYSAGMNATLARKRDLNTYKPRFGSSWDEYRNSTEDRWANINWDYEAIGQFKTMDEIKNYPVDIDGRGNTTMLPGDLIIKDVNGDGVINEYDQRPVGYAKGDLPYVNFSFNGSVAWNRFDLKFDLAGASMQTYYRNWELKNPFQAGGSAPHYLFDDSWHHTDPTDASSAWIAGKYPAVREGAGHINWSRGSTFWMSNITYLKLRTLEIGYTLPKSVTSKVGINSLRFFSNGYNLLSFDNMKEYEVDPEISSDNGLVTPNLRVINFGFNLNF